MPNFDSFGFNGETSNGDGKPTEDITDLDTGKTCLKKMNTAPM